MGATAIFSVPSGAAARPELRQEGTETPKICLDIGGQLSAGQMDEEGMRRIKQLGVDHVLTGGPPIPWEESQIRAHDDLGVPEHPVWPPGSR
jgi:mannonate dehydratase